MSLPIFVLGVYMGELVEQSVITDEGIDQYGTRHQLHIDRGGQLVHQRTFDAQPFLDLAAEDRAQTRGQQWGDMRKVATIPMALYAQIMTMPTKTEQTKAVREFIKDNPAFCTFEKYLK